MPTSSRARPSVAVIGSGLAGLTTAYLLRKEGCEVWLIEKSTSLGFHSASVRIPVDARAGVGDGQQGQEGQHGRDDKTHGRVEADDWVVDVPMRSFQGGYYPLLIALYRHLGLPLVPTNFTYSFSFLRRFSSRSNKPHGNSPTAKEPPSTISPYFIYSGSSGLSLPSLPSKSLSSPLSLIHSLAYLLYTAVSFLLLILLSFVSWHRLLPASLATLDTLRQGLPPFARFIDDILVPIFASVGTMTSSDVLDVPIHSLLDYVHAGFGTAHYRLGGGFSAKSVAERLVWPLLGQGDTGEKEKGEEHVLLGTEIQSMQWRDGQVEVRYMRHGQAQAGQTEFGCVRVDKVVVATQASAAIKLLGMMVESLPAGEEKRVRGMMMALEEVEYRETIVVTHRDGSVLPAKDDIRDINFALPSSFESACASTSDMSSPAANKSSASPEGASTATTSTPYFPALPDKIYTMGTHVIHPPRLLRGEKPVYQTTNPIVPIDPKLVLGVARLERALPLRDPSILARLHPMSKAPGSSGIVHLAGSYAYPGIPLLEGCVGSARIAAARVLERDVDVQNLGGGDTALSVGGVDWDAGRGGVVGRLWRWRRRANVG